jgi:hypothetical protein
LKRTHSCLVTGNHDVLIQICDEECARKLQGSEEVSRLTEALSLRTGLVKVHISLMYIYLSEKLQGFEEVSSLTGALSLHVCTGVYAHIFARLQANSFNFRKTVCIRFDTFVMQKLVKGLHV